MDDTQEVCVYNISDDSYHVHGWLSWNKFDFPTISEKRTDGSEYVEAVFGKLSYTQWKFIERHISRIIHDPLTRTNSISYNYTKLREFIVKFLLKSWSLPVRLDFDACGLLTKECHDTVMRVHPAVMRYFVERFEGELFLDDKERALIAKQSLMLFGNNSIGVKEPVEAISLYCDLTGFWEKFGMNYFEIQQLPQDVYFKLRTVLSNEIDIKSQTYKNNVKKTASRKR